MRVLRQLSSDAARWWVLPVLLLLLLVDMAVWTGWRVQAAPPYVRCMEAPAGPQPCVGERIVFPLQQIHAIEAPGRFRVGRIDGTILVMASSAGLEVGQEVTVGGVRTADGLDADLVETHPGRPWKRRFGLLGVVLLGLMLPLAFSVGRTSGGWRVVPRRWGRRG